MNEQYTRAPHRRGEDHGGISPHAALLIDFDNVTMGIRSNLGQELRKLLDSDIIRGKVAVQRAYADWRRYPQYIVPLSEASIDLIFAPAYGSSKKNATDIRLAIDALELVFTRPEIGTYILMSGDSDFSSLVLKLKEYGKYVIGVGMQESSSDLLVQNCDEYYSYTSIAGLRSADEMLTERHDPWELCARAIERMVDRRDVMRSDRLKQVMLELDSGFDEKEVGYSKFNRFLTEAASRGILALRKAANGQYEVAPGKGARQAARAAERAAAAATAAAVAADAGAETVAAAADAAAGAAEARTSGGGRGGRGNGRGRGTSRRGGRRTETVAGPAGDGRGAEPGAPSTEEGRLRWAYDLLRTVVRDLASGGSTVRDSEVKRKMLERDGEFDEAELGFSKFSRFLRQAYDEEVVDLERGPEGNYHLRPVSDGAGTRDAAAAGEATGAADEAPAAEEAREPRRTGRGRGRKAAEPEASEATGGRHRRGVVSRGEVRGGKEDAEADAEHAGAGAEDGGARAEGHAAERGAEADGAAEEVAPTGEPDSAEAGAHVPAPSAGPPRRTLGRFRRGSRGRGTPAGPAEPGPKFVPGPVDEPGAGKDDEETRAASDAAGAPVPGPVIEGEVGGRATPGGAGASETESGPAPEADSGRLDEERHLVDHLAQNYPGVGRRTAERLVDEFGDRVIEVIDTAPERLADVLPEHRARAVIAGRESERESGDARS